ncbi:MAG: F pilus assembly type-IV secretion system for plasmid transfer, partial [Haloquadratum walsbyi J07HQW1]
MTERIRIPRKLATPIHLFGRFTPRDLVRIGLPILTAALLLKPEPTPANIGGAAAAAITAATWYLVRPAGQTLDTHLYHSIRYATTQILNTSNNTIETRETHIKTNNGSAVAVIKIEPTNLGMKTSDEQKALHTIYRDLLASVTYPIQIHSRQEPLEFNDYINNINTQQKHQNKLRTGYLRLLQKIADSGHNHTQHYITVRVDPSEQKHILTDTDTDEDQLADDLNQRTAEIIEALDTSELNTRRLTGQQLKNTAQALHNPNPHTTIKHNSQPHNGTGEYSQTLVISGLPTDLDIGWTLNLLRTNARVDITQTIKPCKPSDAT